MSQTLVAPTSNRAKAWYFVHDFFFIVLGVCLYVLGWAGFVLSQEIATGGLAGVTTIIQIATNIPAFIPYNIINVGLLIVSIIFLGWRYSIKTLIGVILMGIAIPIGQALFGDPNTEVYHNLNHWLTDNIPNVGPLLREERFMAVIIGGILCGSGLFLVFHVNGSTGGTDIVAAIVNKYRDISLGRVILICDLVIISSSYLALHDWEKVIYGYVVLFITSFCVDQVVNSMRRSVQFFIISDRYEEIGRQINENPHRGCTVINASGFYSGREMKMLFVLAKKSESGKIFDLINDIDPAAFVSQSAVIGVYGEGFDRFKARQKKNAQNKLSQKKQGN